MSDQLTPTTELARILDCPDVAEDAVPRLTSELTPWAAAQTAAAVEALREAYTLLISAEPTLIRDARTYPNDVSRHYKEVLRDRTTAWLDQFRDHFEEGVSALLNAGGQEGD